MAGKGGTYPSGRPEVVVLGDINLDLIARYPRFPMPGQDALASSLDVHCGGSAVNTAVTLHGLGLQVRLIGRVGREPLAELALRRLRGSGVLLAAVQRDPALTTGLIYIIVTPDGERTMLSIRGANVETSPELVAEVYFRRARHFHLSGYALLSDPQRQAARRALRLSRENHLFTSLDPGTLLCQSAPGEVLDLLDGVGMLVPTWAEARALTGRSLPEECAAALLSLGAKVSFIKLGRNGCLLAAQDELIRLPAFPIQARDTTGAGDAFNAGAIAGHLAGLEWVASGLLANACGAAAASRIGSGDQAPGCGEVRALLDAHRAHPGFAAFRSEIEHLLDFLAPGPARGWGRSRSARPL